MKYRPKHIIEYAFFRGITTILRTLPYRGALSAGWLLAWMGHYIFKFRADSARDRICEVMGGGISDREVRRIAWLSFRNLFFSAVEILRAPGMQVRDFGRIYDLDVPRAFASQLQKTGSGAIFAVVHIGNWDLAGIVADRCGLPMFFMARRQKNPLVDAYLNRMRGSHGADTMLNDRLMMKVIINELKAGKVLAILPDVRAKTPALSIRFLGKEANLGRGMAMFSRQAGVPIYPCLLRRKGWSYHEWVITEPIYPDPAVDKHEDAERVTQAAMDVFTAHIKKNPDQYFWYNKRWVLEPLTAEPAAAENRGGT